MPECATAPADKLLLTVEEAAHALSLSVRTVHKLVAADALGTVRIGRSVRFSHVALERFVLEHAQARRTFTWDDGRTAKALCTSAAPVAGVRRSGSVPECGSPPTAGAQRRRVSGSRPRSTRTRKELQTLAARIGSAPS